MQFNDILKERGFSILQWLDPDMEREAAIAIKTRWKQRLHTRAATGLNAN